MSKISELLKEGVITIEEVLEYAQQHMDAVDAYDDEQLQNSEWECSEGTLHPGTQDSCDCHMFNQDAPYEMTEDEIEYEKQRRLEEEYYDGHFAEIPSPSPDPKYVLASTWHKMQETMLFECDEDGNILTSDDYGCIAKRFGHNNWTNSLNALKLFFPYKKYGMVKDLGLVNGIHRRIYERHDLENDLPKEMWEHINKIEYL
jgi:hypothetical protein